MVSTEPYDAICKIAVVGDEGTGKSCLVHRCLESAYNDGLPPTVGVDFKARSVHDGGEIISKLTVWDAGGT